MFKARIDAIALKEYLELITAIVDEGKLKITESGIELKSVDAANVAMIDFKLSCDAFSEFELNAKEETDSETVIEKEIGLDFEKLLSIFGVGGSDEVELEIDSDKQKLHAKMGSLAYSVSLLDPASLRREPKVPELDFSAQIVIEGSEFRKTIRAMERVSDHVMFGIKEGTFFVETWGETDVLKMELQKDQLIDLTERGKVNSLFSIEYIVAMSRGMSHIKDITIHLDKDMPLLIESDLAEGKGKIRYLLAPRIEG